MFAVVVQGNIFDSSKENEKLARERYPDSPVERFVATTLGDEMRPMSDALAELKEQGVGFVDRHLEVWTNPANHQFDVQAQQRQIEMENQQDMKNFQDQFNHQHHWPHGHFPPPINFNNFLQRF